MNLIQNKYDEREAERLIESALASEEIIRGLRNDLAAAQFRAEENRRSLAERTDSLQECRRLLIESVNVIADCGLHVDASDDPELVERIEKLFADVEVAL